MRIGEKVNIEIDILARYVDRILGSGEIKTMKEQGVEISSTQSIIEDAKEWENVHLVDHGDRENEGNLVIQDKWQRQMLLISWLHMVRLFVWHFHL